MSIPHDTVRDDLRAYALGTLDPTASERMEQHLHDCVDCRELMREYEEVMRLLPLGLPPTEPSIASRRELVHRLRHDGSPSARSSTGHWWVRPRLQTLAAVVLAFAVVASALAWSQTDDDAPNASAIVEGLRKNPDTQIVSMRGSEDAPQAVAQLFFQPGTTQAGLVVSGLPPLPDDRVYQLWFVHPDETRYDAGTFSVDQDGQAIIAIDAPAQYGYGWSCAVTEEPAGGSDWPTGRNVLRGSYEDYDW